MKSLALFLAGFAAASACTWAGESTRFETQLRSDLRTILKARWPAEKAAAEADAYADTWLCELKTAYPELLPTDAEPEVPNDVRLALLQDEASQRRVPKTKGEIWCFYQDGWRRRLNPEQRILFGRFLEIVIAEAKKRTPPKADIQRLDPEIQRLEDELQRLKDQARG